MSLLKDQILYLENLQETKPTKVVEPGEADFPGLLYTQDKAAVFSQLKRQSKSAIIAPE